MSLWRLFFPILILIVLGGCAHSYFYSPEIAGEGAIHGKRGGIVYTIPSTGQGELTMRVRALGIHKVHNFEMLGMRMSFGRPAGSSAVMNGTQEFVNPAEQLIRIGDGNFIKPAYVRSKEHKLSVVPLNGSTHEVIELLYPLSKDSEGAPGISSYYFQWIVHYGDGKVEQQTARFDRQDAAPQQAAEIFPEDPDYPYDMSPIDVPGWTVIRGPYWWPLDPWWPWW